MEKTTVILATVNPNMPKGQQFKVLDQKSIDPKALATMDLPSNQQGNDKPTVTLTTSEPVFNPNAKANANANSGQSKASTGLGWKIGGTVGAALLLRRLFRSKKKD